ncbi:hypothetical protein Droror1_Dr00011753 [Drosera rotundifolia]
MLSDFDLRQLLLDNMKGFPHPRPNLPSMGHSIWSKTLMPSNLDDVFLFFSFFLRSPPPQDILIIQVPPFLQNTILLSAFNSNSSKACYQPITYQYKYFLTEKH